MRSLILALGRGPTGQSADRHGALGRQEDLHRADGARALLVEGRGVIRKQLTRSPVGGDGVLEHLFGISTVLMAGIGAGAHIESGGIIEQLIDRRGGPTDEPVLEGIELSQRHRSRASEGDVRGLRTLLRRGLDLAHAGQQPGDGRHRRNLLPGEGILDGGLIVDRPWPIVPPVSFELPTDPDQFVDDLWAVPPGRGPRGPEARVQCCCGLLGPAAADLVEHAARDLH